MDSHTEDYRLHAPRTTVHIDMTSVLDEQVLSDALAATLADSPRPVRLEAVLDRRSNAWSSTFESEIVTCRIDNGGELKLLCKYEQFQRSNAHDHESWGHRRGNGYEADVYRRVLEPLGAAVPRCFGVHRDSRTGTSCLFLEYLEGAQHLEDVEALPTAATWLAQFHRRAEPFASIEEASFLTRYDRHYYAGWARRTSQFAEPFLERYDWVPAVCARFAEHAAPVLERQSTVIHGEYYRNNLLLHRGSLYVIDWESCAVGAGEVDLAMLVEGWPQERVDEIEWLYSRERWPGRADQGFAERLALAKVYVHFRWLGDQRDWTPFELWRFDELRVASERAGLLT